MKEIDTFGRVLIPKEIRKELNINKGDKLHISCIDNTVIVKKVHDDICDSCGEKTYTKQLNLCQECVKKLSVKL